MILIFSDIYALVENLMWSVLCMLCVYIQLIQQFQTQPIDTGVYSIWGVGRFVTMILRAIDATDVVYILEIGYLIW